MPPGPVSSRVTGTFFDSCILSLICLSERLLLI